MEVSHNVVAMAAIEQNIVGSFQTYQVIFQLDMLIYTQTITEKCQNLLQYVYFCTYEGHLYDPIVFAIKTAYKITKLKSYLKKKYMKSLFQQYFNPKLSKYRILAIFGKMGFDELVLNRLKSFTFSAVDNVKGIERLQTNMKTESSFTFMLSNTDRITTNNRGHGILIE